MARQKKAALQAVIADLAPYASLVPKLVIDFGNAQVKAIIGLVVIIFAHAMAEITEAEYLIAIKDLRNSEDRWDYFKFDGKFYVVGKSARRFDLRRQGRSKYDRSYMGPFIARVAIEWMRKVNDPNVVIATIKDEPITVFASHPPRDAEFSGHLSKGLKGEYVIEAADDLKIKFRIGTVNTFYESFGSYQFLRLNESDMLDGEVGLIDIGGGTCSVLRVGADGIIVPGSGDNTRTGINSVLDVLRGSIEHAYPDVFAKGHVDPVRLENSLRTGVYKAGGYGDLKVEELVKKALSPMLNDISDLYTTRLGGGLSIDTLVLTGGGTALTFKRVKALLNHRVTLPAVESPMSVDPDFTNIQISNARGTRLFLDALEAAGVG